MSKIKVLQVVGQLMIGGQESMVMNFCRFIDRTEIEFDFLVYGYKVGEFEAEAKMMGGKVIHVPSLVDVGYHKFMNELDIILKDNGPYNVIHSHTSFNSGFIMKAARIRGIPVRIAHSHTTKPGKKATVQFRVYSQIMRADILNNATHLVACGISAGYYLFGRTAFRKRGMILNNGISIKKFTFDPRIRNEMRKEFGVADNFVIGHIGRMSVEKNHSYLIDIFSEIHKINSEAFLFLVGSGPLLDEIKDKVTELGILGNVIFAGQRIDIPALLQLMDVFVFPSIYEGLPVSVIEAQASGLPCIISNRVASDVKITDLVEFVDLDISTALWIDKILDKEKFVRKDMTEDIRKSGYDINDICKQLEVIYLQRAIV